jgi:inner membrane protein
VDFLSLLIATPIGTQAFWVWMVLGLALLGLEMLLGTQWLLWSAASAGVVAIITLLGVPMGIITQIVIFTALSVTSALWSRKLLKPATDQDINDPHQRMRGQPAIVLSGFEGGNLDGRVSFDGVEWPAVAEGAVSFAPDTRVTIVRVNEGKLYIKA